VHRARIVAARAARRVAARMAVEVAAARMLAVRHTGAEAEAEVRRRLLVEEGDNIARAEVRRRMAEQAEELRMAGVMERRIVGAAAEAVARSPEEAADSIDPGLAEARRTAGEEAAVGSSPLVEEGALVRSAMSPSSSRSATHGHMVGTRGMTCRKNLMLVQFYVVEGRLRAVAGCRASTCLAITEWVRGRGKKAQGVRLCRW
jgi:hypothetical protein